MGKLNAIHDTFTPAEQAFLYAVRQAQHQKIPSPPYKVIAKESGFKIYSLHHARQRLEERGVVQKQEAREAYTQKVYGGRIQELERIRTTYVLTEEGHRLLSQSFLLKSKKQPPKVENKNPHRKHLFPDSYPSGLFGKDMKDLWDLYQQHFVVGHESLSKTIQLLRQDKKQLPATSVLRQSILKAKGISFLKIANRFGFQEAVVECYQRKNVVIGAHSKHIDKYSSKKLTFLWLIKHANRILKGDYDEKPLSQPQQDFGTQKSPEEGRAEKRDGQSIDKTPAESALPTKEVIIEEIKTSTCKSSQKRAHIALLEKTSPAFYHLWLRGQEIDTDGKDVYITADTSFREDVLRRTFMTDARVHVVDQSLRPLERSETEFQKINDIPTRQQNSSLAATHVSDKDRADSKLFVFPCQKQTF